MKKNEKPPTKQEVVVFLRRVGRLDSTIFTTRQYLSDRAVRLGAKYSISASDGIMDFYFNEEDLLVGTATQNRGSFRKYRPGKKLPKFKGV